MHTCILHNPRAIPLALLLIAGAATGLRAQPISESSASSSPTYFSESKTIADGGDAGSATYALTATVGESQPALASSSTYSLSGGFLGTLDATASGPWLTSARPLIHPPQNGNLMWLSGSRLDLAGPAPTVTVDGQACTVVARSQTDIGVQLPALLPPGFHQVTLTNSGGSSSLERGIGVLPLLYTDTPPVANKPFSVVYKGSPGDIVFWAIAFADGPVVPLSNFLHGISLSLSFFRVLPSFTIPGNTDEVRFPVPASQLGVTVFVQGLFVPASGTSPYAPGSFSNMLKF